MLNTERLCLGCMNDNGGETVCPICGFDSNTQNGEDCLPCKFVINNRYLVGKVQNITGDSITYIGWDNSTDSIVNIKEYFPKNVAIRNPDKTVSMHTDHKFTFNEGLMEFLEINTAIMKSELPSLIPVVDVFEESGTVYAINSSIQGITLADFLKRNGDTLKWEQARALFLPLIDTIKGMNDLGIIHGGISEETIIVGRDGKLRISEYSIKNARKLTSKLEAKIYKGFAAIEQYDVVGLNMDTYTDVYGLSATLFKVFIGTTPPDALVRVQNDAMTISAKFAEELPRNVLAALANGLQVLPKERTKDIETFKNELIYGEISEPAPKKNATKENENAPQKPKKKKGSTAKYVIISSLCTILVFGAIAAALVATVFKDVFFPSDSEVSSQEVTSIDAPEVDKLGDVDSDAANSTKLYEVADFTGKYYSEIIDDKDNDVFEFIIKSKEFSTKYPKGTVCSQSVKAGKQAARDTKIKLVISLGPQEIKIANLAGLDETSAKLELLKQGFIYDNITVAEKYDADRDPGVVLDQSPKYGEAVNTDVAVTIYINSYEGETTDENGSENQITDFQQ